MKAQPCLPRFSCLRVAVCMLICAPVSAFAQVEPGSAANWWQEALQSWREGVNTYQITVENDSLLLKRDDGMYTSGARLELQSWQSDARRAQMSRWHLSHEIYSPLDIKLPAALIPLREHPYAAWLATGMSFTEWQINGSMFGLGLDIGCLGPCAAGEATQKNLHRLLNQPLPQGWAKQVRNEWGVIAQLDWAASRYVFNPQADLQANGQIRFGNINTDATVGALLRFGKLNALPQQAASYGYLQAQVRGVAYDATMQGGYFSKNNPHTVDPKPLYGQIELGMQWVGPEYAARVAVVRRGNTIRDLPNSMGTQNYAVLQFSYTPTR